MQHIHLKCPTCENVPNVHSEKSLESKVSLYDGLGRKEGSAGSSLLTLTFNPCGHVFVVQKGALVSITSVDSTQEEPFSHSTEKKEVLQTEAVDAIILSLAKHQGKMDAIKFFKTFSDESLKDSQAYVEQVLQKAGIKPKQGCFIATACYGSYHAPQVVTLRYFRDHVLEKSELGRMFVKLYYIFSPKIVELIDPYPWLKSFIRVVLLDKLVKMIKHKLCEN